MTKPDRRFIDVTLSPSKGDERKASVMPKFTKYDERFLNNILRQAQDDISFILTLRL